MTDQLFIKVLLIAIAVVFAFVIMRRSTSARNQALRTISLLLFLAVVIVSVLFPSIINNLAIAVGIGRGTDLLFYGFMIVFVGSLLSNSRKDSSRDRQITELARSLALSKPLLPTRESGDTQ